MNRKKVTEVVVQPAALTVPPQNREGTDNSSYTTLLTETKPLADVAPNAFENAIREATDPQALKRTISRIRSMLESSEAGVGSENSIFGMFGERFNEEGFHSEHPQIAAIHEYLPVFMLTQEEDSLSISKTELNKIISRVDLRATPVHDLIEIQKLVRNSVVESTMELFKIFYKGYHLEDMNVENIQDLDPRYQELFEFKSFIELTQEIDQKTEVFKDIQYNFSANNIDNVEIIEKLKSDLSSKYMYYADFVEKYIDVNPYISSVIGYYVLSRFAKGLVAVLKLILENKESFLESFYIDVITNDSLLENSLNSNQDNQLINAYRELDSSALIDVNKTLKHFFSEKIPTSLGMIRFIKGIHAFGSGFIEDAITESTPYADSEENPGSLNGISSASAINYLTKSRKCRVVSFAFDACYRSESHEHSQIEAYSALYSDNFDYGLAEYNELSTIRALLPMIYDIKNTITFPDVKDAQADLIGKQLFGSNNTLTSKIPTIKSNNTSVPPNPIDTEKDIAHMWDLDLGIDLSKEGMSDLDVGNLLYSNLQNGKNLLIVDNKGYTNDKVSAEDNISMKDFAFAIASSLRDDGNNTEVARICQKVQESANKILSDITDNYGIAGMSDFSSLPEEYMSDFFEFIADELIYPMYNTPNNSGANSDTVLHFITGLNFLVADSNAQFKKDLWKEGCWYHNYLNGASIDYVRMSDPKYVIPGSGFGGVGTHDGYEKIRNAPSGYYGQGEPTGMQQADEPDVAGDNNAYYTHDPDEKFSQQTLFDSAHIYGDPLNASVGRSKESFSRTPSDIIFNYLYYNIIPGTKNSVGTGNTYENGSTGLTTLGQWEGSEYSVNPFDDGSYMDFSTQPRHFMDSSKSDSSRTLGNGGLTSSKLDQSITICTAKNLGDCFRDALEPNPSTAGLVSKILEFDGNFLRKYSDDLGSKIGLNSDEDGQTANMSCNDASFITSNNALGTSSVARSYLLYFLLVRLLGDTINLKILTRGRDGAANNDSNNGARNIEIHFNADQLQGLHDALKRYSKPTNPKSNYETGYDSGAEFTESLIARCKHSEAGLLASAVSLIRIRNFFGNLKTRTTESFDHTSVINLRDFIENFDEDLEYLNSFSYDQRNLSTFLNLTLLNPSIANFHLPSLKDITNDQIDCMKKFLSQDKYIYKDANIQSNTKKMYVMHLGITNSLIDTLRDRLIQESGIVDFTSDANIRALKDIRDRSIIKINLYRKDLINDESIQLRSYLFDVNKYMIENVKHQSVSNTKLTAGLPAASSVGTFLSLHKLFDFRSGIDSGSGREFAGKLYTNYKSVVSDERNSITEAELEQLYTNHFEDFYLKLYCKSITGLDFDEDVFINNNIARQILDTNNQSLNVIQNYNAAFKSHLDNLLNLSGNDQTYINERYRIEKEAKRSLYFSTEKYMKRVLYPKTFDRVFSVFVDLNNQQNSLETSFNGDNTLTLDRFYYTVTLTDKLALFDADPVQSSNENNAIIARVVTSAPQAIQNLQLTSPASGSPISPAGFNNN